MKLKRMEEEAKQMAETARENLKRKMEEELPEEPLDEDEDSCGLRFRLPSGDVMSRNFLRSDPLKVLFTYVASKGYPVDEYKLLRAYPRKDISREDENVSIADTGIRAKELLTIERR